MRRTSKYHPLRFIVECAPTNQPFFESIAAFNHCDVAKQYAIECRVGKPDGYRYRVLHCVHNEDRCIYRSDVNA